MKKLATLFSKEKGNMFRYFAAALLLGVFLVAMGLFPTASTTSANPLVFRCAEHPLPEFTLGEGDSPSDQEIAELCSCIWNDFSPGRKKVAEAIHRGEDPQIPGLDIEPDGILRAFGSWFGEAVRACYASAEPHSGLTFSKQTIRPVFSMSRTQWNAIVNAAASRGEALAGDDFATGVSMTAPIEGGFMTLSPDYSEEKAPDFVQVTIGYRRELAPYITIERLNDDLLRAQTDLSPMFEVYGNVESFEGGLGIFLTIVPAE